MVIAEGIECAEEGAKLLELGCNFGQGYFWDKPMPLKEFEFRYGTPQAEPREHAETKPISA